MGESTGIIIFFDEYRRTDLLKEQKEGGYFSFSDALSVQDWEIKSLQVALISFSMENIDFIGLATKGNRVVTAKSRIEFSDLVSLNSLPIKKVEKKLDSSIRKHFIRSSQGSGAKVPLKTWQGVISVIKELRPDNASEIDRLLSISVLASKDSFVEMSDTFFHNDTSALMGSTTLSFLFQKEFIIFWVMIVMGMVVKEFKLKSLSKRVYLNLALLGCVSIYSALLIFLMFKPVFFQ